MFYKFNKMKLPAGNSCRIHSQLHALAERENANLSSFCSLLCKILNKYQTFLHVCLSNTKVCVPQRGRPLSKEDVYWSDWFQSYHKLPDRSLSVPSFFPLSFSPAFPSPLPFPLLPFLPSFFLLSLSFLMKELGRRQLLPCNCT